jgi:hypothetical protein
MRSSPHIPEQGSEFATPRSKSSFTFRRKAYGPNLNLKGIARHGPVTASVQGSKKAFGNLSKKSAACLYRVALSLPRIFAQSRMKI